MDWGGGCEWMWMDKRIDAAFGPAASLPYLTLAAVPSATLPVLTKDICPIWPGNDADPQKQNKTKKSLRTIVGPPSADKRVCINLHK